MVLKGGRRLESGGVHLWPIGRDGLVKEEGTRERRPEEHLTPRGARGTVDVCAKAGRKMNRTGTRQERREITRRREGGKLPARIFGREEFRTDTELEKDAQHPEEGGEAHNALAIEMGPQASLRPVSFSEKRKGDGTSATVNTEWHVEQQTEKS